MIDKYLLLLSGGVGSRFKNSLPKQYFKDEEGSTFFLKSLKPFEGLIFNGIVIVCDPNYKDIIYDELKKINLVGKIIFSNPGKDRQESIDKGVNKIQDIFKKIEDQDQLFIQESVRPYVDKKTIQYLLDAPSSWYAVSPAINPYVLFGKKSKNNEINELLEKKDILELQLPKRYNLKFMIEYRKKMQKPSEEFIDESEIFLSFGKSIHTTPGSPNNIKITFPHHRIVFKFNNE